MPTIIRIMLLQVGICVSGKACLCQKYVSRAPRLREAGLHRAIGPDIHEGVKHVRDLTCGEIRWLVIAAVDTPEISQPQPTRIVEKQGSSPGSYQLVK